MQLQLALLAAAGLAAAQAPPAPPTTHTGGPPAGCDTTVSGTFKLGIASVAPAKRGLAARQDSEGQLSLSLNNGILKDSNGRTGYIASNYQFQFDNPPQPDALSTSGFSVCQNKTIALGGSAIWYSCSSGSSFDNLYDRPFGDMSKCKPVYFQAQGAGEGSGASSAPASSASAAPSPAPPATTAATAPTVAPAPPAPTVAVGGASTLVAEGLVFAVGVAGAMALL